MPQSKNRHPHKHIQQHHHHESTGTHSKPRKTNRSIIVTIIFFTLIGLGISFFIDAKSIFSLLTGAVLGGIAGYIFGYQVNKSLSGK